MVICFYVSSTCSMSAKESQTNAAVANYTVCKYEFGIHVASINAMYWCRFFFVLWIWEFLFFLVSFTLNFVRIDTISSHKLCPYLSPVHFLSLLLFVYLRCELFRVNVVYNLECRTEVRRYKWQTSANLFQGMIFHWKSFYCTFLLVILFWNSLASNNVCNCLVAIIIIISTTNFQHNRCVRPEARCACVSWIVWEKKQWNLNHNRI